MRKTHRLALIAGLAAIFADAAAAQSLQVTPVLLEMSPNRRGAVLEVLNTSSAAVDVQIRPYDWRQSGGEDQLTDSSTLRVSPSIATIPPGATQTIRLLAPAETRTVDGSWRILLDQLPQPVAGGGLQVRLRMSIPVFAFSTKVADADVRWQFSGGRLEARNAGRRYARLGDLGLRRADGTNIPLPLGKMPYLLPGSTRHWDVAPAKGLTVVGFFGGTAFSAPVALGLEQ